MVGPSGIGKSTLAALMAGLLPRPGPSGCGVPGPAPSGGPHSAGGVRLHRHRAREPPLPVPGTAPGRRAAAPPPRPSGLRAGGADRRPGRTGRARGTVGRGAPAARARPRPSLPRAAGPAGRGDLPSRPGGRGARGTGLRRAARRHADRRRPPAQLGAARRPGAGDGRPRTAYGTHEELLASSSALPRPGGLVAPAGGAVGGGGGAVTPSPRPGRSGWRRPGYGPRSCG